MAFPKRNIGEEALVQVEDPRLSKKEFESEKRWLEDYFKESDEALFKQLGWINGWGCGG